MKRLSELELGEWGMVREITGNPAIQRRLATMGFVPGTLVEVKHCAPMGDPRAYVLISRVPESGAVSGYCISLRHEEADLIQVEPLPVYPLTSAPRGKVQVLAITGGRGIRQKFSRLGIGEGVSLSNRANPTGPLIVEIAGKEVSLGRGIAERIKVTILSENGKTGN